MQNKLSPNLSKITVTLLTKLGLLKSPYTKSLRNLWIYKNHLGLGFSITKSKWLNTSAGNRQTKGITSWSFPLRSSKKPTINGSFNWTTIQINFGNLPMTNIEKERLISSQLRMSLTMNFWTTSSLSNSKSINFKTYHWSRQQISAKMILLCWGDSN